jgi:hypothetical protein
MYVREGERPHKLTFEHYTLLPALCVLLVNTSLVLVLIQDNNTGGDAADTTWVHGMLSDLMSVARSTSGMEGTGTGTNANDPSARSRAPSRNTHLPDDSDDDESDEDSDDAMDGAAAAHAHAHAHQHHHGGNHPPNGTLRRINGRGRDMTEEEEEEMQQLSAERTTQQITQHLLAVAPNGQPRIDAVRLCTLVTHQIEVLFVLCSLLSEKSKVRNMYVCVCMYVCMYV